MLLNWVRNSVDPARTFLSKNVVRTSALRILRMRKPNTNKAVPLDTVPERRTERCSPRFRPGGRFCELRLRYQSSPTGREGEISRPLDHMWQIPFIRSTQYISCSHFYLNITVFWLFPPCGTFKCLSTRYLTITHAPWRKHSFQAMLCSMRFVLVHIGTKWIAFTHACPLSRVINLIYISTYLFIYLFIYSLFPIPSF